MKKSLLLLIILFSFSLKSQTYKPLLVDGNKWTINWGDGGIPNICAGTVVFSSYQYEIVGDSIVNGQNYKKIYHSFPQLNPERKRDCNHIEPTTSSYYLSALLREDISTRKVYKNVLGTTNEVLLYDFSVGINSVHDSNNFEIGFLGAIPNLTVSSIQNASIFGQNTKIYNFQNGYLIEGIGNDSGLLEHIGWSGSFETFHRLSCFENTAGVSCSSTAVMGTDEVSKRQDLILYYSKENKNLRIIDNERKNYVIKFHDYSGRFIEEVKVKGNELFTLKNSVTNLALFYTITEDKNIWTGKLIIQ